MCKGVKINNNSYTASYYYLEDQLKNSVLKIKKVAGKQRNIESNHELDTIFKLVKQTFECSCCEDKPIESFSQCTEGHLICKGCIKKHAENTIYLLCR